MYSSGDYNIIFKFTNDKENLLCKHESLEKVTKDVTTKECNWRDMLRYSLIITSLVATIYIISCSVLWYGARDTGMKPGAPEKVISCYYNTPSNNNMTRVQRDLLPSDIDPHLCTHINVAFARVINKQIYMEPSQGYVVRQVVALKRLNPALKVLLSVGGAGQNNGFSEMVVDHASRKTFIRSLKDVLRNYSLDGVDLDWEFPALHVRRGRERQHFSQLLREIRAEYERERRGYLLTVAVAAPRTIVDVSYDVGQIDLYADYANLMTYDFHYYSRFTPFTGLNSPLYPRAGEDLYPATLNVDRTVRMYAEKGLRAEKTLVGIPTYGHSFTLVNAENAGVGAPASGVGALGGGGFVEYGAVLRFLARGGVSVLQDEGARVPYLRRGGEWVSCESPRSVAEKARYAARRGLRGAMLYSLNADERAFPLARAVRRALLLPHDH